MPADHPLRAVKRRCDRILADMRRDFNAERRSGAAGDTMQRLTKPLNHKNASPRETKRRQADFFSGLLVEHTERASNIFFP